MSHPRICEVILFGNSVFADTMEDLEKRSLWIVRVSPKSDGSVLVRDRRGDAGREKAHEDKAESGVMQPQTRECPEPPGAGGSEEEASPRKFRGLQSCPHLDCRLLASRPERTNLCHCKPPGLWQFVTAAPGN